MISPGFARPAPRKADRPRAAIQRLAQRALFGPEQVFAIARDVARYKEFLPLVKRSIVRNVTTQDDGRETFEGELTVASDTLRIEEVMTSQVTVEPASPHRHS
jgi:ribosome-associated toxin RatA of RatAB toxin-antitoxin module